MKKSDETSTSKKENNSHRLPRLPATDPNSRAEKLINVCIEMLELCIEVTGTIDPAAAWLVVHAKDEVTLATNGTRDLRPYWEYMETPLRTAALMIDVIAVWRGSADGLCKSAPASKRGGEAMLNVLEEFRRYPTIDNAARLRDYFERYPSRMWLLRSDSLRVLEAAGV
jgi:hypothetical protein